MRNQDILGDKLDRSFSFTHKKHQEPTLPYDTANNNLSSPLHQKHNSMLVNSYKYEGYL